MKKAKKATQQTPSFYDFLGQMKLAKNISQLEIERMCKHAVKRELQRLDGDSERKKGTKTQSESECDYLRRTASRTNNNPKQNAVIRANFSQTMTALMTDTDDYIINNISHHYNDGDDLIGLQLDLSADMYQTAYVRILEHLHALKPTDHIWRSTLYRLALNGAKAQRRSFAITQNTLMTDDELNTLTVDDIINDIIDSADFRTNEMVDRLTKTQKVYITDYLNGLTMVEIARKHGVCVGTVLTQFSRIRESMI